MQCDGCGRFVIPDEYCDDPESALARQLTRLVFEGFEGIDLIDGVRTAWVTEDDGTKKLLDLCSECALELKVGDYDWQEESWIRPPAQVDWTSIDDGYLVRDQYGACVEMEPWGDDLPF